MDNANQKEHISWSELKFLKQERNMDQSFLLPVLLLNLFLLCQLGSAMQSRPGAASTNSAGLPYKQNPYNRERPYSYSLNCDTDHGLPCPETDALSTVISRLELSPAPSISRSFCNESKSLNSITINCDCSGSVCHITEIIMENVGLSGVIDEDVGKLTYLKTFDLSDNKIHDSIPDEIGKLTKLTTLDLSSNQLSGRIPNSLGNLSNLESLNLKLNLLTGGIPQSLGKLSSLVYLNLKNNKLSSEIPHELGNLSQLEYLRLDDNELYGELPPELGKLSNLEEFWVTSNNLKGKLPKDYDNLRNLLSFEVGGNYLSGPIYPFIANWTNLTSLNLIGNDFDGGLPPEIFNMTSLEYLWVSDLKEPGFAFPESANLTSAFQVILRNCSITGVIPDYIGNLSWLSTLDLSFNQLTGGIPDSFQNLSLNKMFLTENKLSGKIPAWINKVVYAKGDLSYNDFTFTEPGNEHMYQLSNNSNNVTFLDTRKINVEPKNRTNIYQIMDERCHDKKSKFHSLFINAGGEETTIGTRHYDADNSTSPFYVSPNNWAYSCSGYFQSSSSNTSDYIKNMTCGAPSLEAPLYEKARLCPQALTYYGFCLQNGNYTVKLHFAETVYAKDEDYSSLGKRVFDIYIQGTRVWKDYNIKQRARGPNKICNETFTAHVKDNLLEIRLFWAGKGSMYNPPSLNGPLISAISVTPDFRVGGLSYAQIAGITVAAIFIPLLLLALMWRIGWVGHKDLRDAQVELRGKSYTVKQVVDATRNFSSKMEIGRGQFGIVYKAELPDQTVAVKKLSPHSKQVIDQIGREVYTLKTVKHQNLVEFLDGYSKKGLHLLIYEYMEHSSLAFALFDPKSNLELDWNTRFNICLGIAKALKYLHEDSRLKIVHRNIKPSNILLDGKLNAKVSDFGLAKLYEEENMNVAIGAGDTLVYMAPEYATVKVVTDKADVYSYGIVLLEIVSGKRNADYEANQEYVYLIDTACLLHAKGKLVDLIDEKLHTYNRDQVLNILNIAMLCIDRSPTLRPTMSEVVSVLEGDKKVEDISKDATPSA
ncbi:hypothetical protein JRO89_XS04G0284300 [Xanthoceras sorbifolium]|uniref:non-specific serine/threonine protein kinase n=1 Tax=Xanthoceras sorbifolium TaxID=99658 RepID=A0ABQ8I8K4_9ROSI|nr:hypothetical protein JRO89_XS04G0284300 [Xanthoceras sorbifolium]